MHSAESYKLKKYRVVVKTGVRSRCPDGDGVMLMHVFAYDERGAINEARCRCLDDFREQVSACNVHVEEDVS